MDLRIGDKIRRALLSSESLRATVGDKIFPLATEQETTFPFILYRRSGLSPNPSKDSVLYGSVATVEISVPSDDYDSGLDIAILVIDAMTSQHADFGPASLTGASEDFTEGAFVQYLTFEIKLKK